MKHGAWIAAVAVNIAVLAALAALALAGLELWLRLTVPPSSSESIFEYTTRTPRYKVMKPRAKTTAWGEELRTNDLGFRDRSPIVPPKASGEFRVVVLGDSFTVSAGVPFAQIYTTRLQRLLEVEYPQARVFNLAVGGYNIVQYALALEEIGLALEPDLVLLALFPDNDFSNDTYEENYRVAAGLQPAVPELAWYEKTYVYGAYGSRVEARLAALLGRGAARSEEDARRGWEDNVAALRRIARMTAERNIRLEAALLPATWDFEGQGRLFAPVKRVCREIGIACLDLLPAFLAARVRESWLRLNALDSHPNARYNAIVARALSPYLGDVLASRAGRVELASSSRLPSPPGGPARLARDPAR